VRGLFTWRGWAAAGAVVLGALTLASCAAFSAVQAPPGASAPPSVAPAQLAAEVGIKLPDPGRFSDTDTLKAEARSRKAGTLEATGDGRQVWAVAKTVGYRTEAGDLVLMRAGMSTDLASIPWYGRLLLPSDGTYQQGAVAHDICYQSSGSFTWRGHLGHAWAQPYTRPQCDGLLRETMHQTHVAAWRRYVIVVAVRLGGANGWGH
jgi:hypothetical protein